MQTPNPEQPTPQSFSAKAWDKRSVELLRQAVLTSPMGVVVPQEAMLDLLATIDQATEQVRVLREHIERNTPVLEDLLPHISYLMRWSLELVVTDSKAVLANTTPAPQQGEEGKR